MTNSNSSDIFLLPIEYTHFRKIDEVTLHDLEIINTKKNTIDPSSQSLFQTMYSSSHSIEHLHSEKHMSYFTTDISFLTDTQCLITKLVKNIPTIEPKVAEECYDYIQSINNEEEFHGKYQYIDVSKFRSMNHNSSFMQVLSLYNLTSPAITLLTPLVVLILPFFLIRWQGIPLSLSSYTTIIKNLLKNHAIGRLASAYGDVSWDKRVYLLVTAGFYLFQIYQSALSCYRFSTNMKHIHNVLYSNTQFVIQTCQTGEYLLETGYNKLTSYKSFFDELSTKMSDLKRLRNNLQRITPLTISITKACQIGQVMKLYYDLRFDKTTHDSLEYSFHLYTYLQRIRKLNELNLGKATFSSKNKWKVYKMYEPNAGKRSSVDNSFDLKHPMLLTGPNASGKTTLLKSAFMNSLLSQQFGMGMYKRLIFKPYTHFHCYLDIPDTSGRDSLFQAEARRCLDIVTQIEENEQLQSNHFCIFDEIYSGTNPTEAVASAFAFIKYLSKRRNTTFILTTHFYNLCELASVKRLPTRNMQMGWTHSTSKDLIYTYKLKKDISNLKGGVAVLKNLGYPDILIKDAQIILNGLIV